MKSNPALFLSNSVVVSNTPHRRLRVAPSQLVAQTNSGAALRRHIFLCGFLVFALSLSGISDCAAEPEFNIKGVQLGLTLAKIKDAYPVTCVESNIVGFYDLSCSVLQQKVPTVAGLDPRSLTVYFWRGYVSEFMFIFSASEGEALKSALTHRYGKPETDAKASLPDRNAFIWYGDKGCLRLWIDKDQSKGTFLRVERYASELSDADRARDF